MFDTSNIYYRLRVSYGVFSKNDLKDVEKAFGDNYRVGVEFHGRKDRFMTLGQIEGLPKRNPKLYDDVIDFYIIAN